MACGGWSSAVRSAGRAGARAGGDRLPGGQVEEVQRRRRRSRTPRGCPRGRRGAGQPGVAAPTPLPSERSSSTAASSMSLAISSVASVTTGSASSRRCTSFSGGTFSTSSTSATRRGHDGSAVAASRRLSGRRPSATGTASAPARVGKASSAPSASVQPLRAHHELEPRRRARDGGPDDVHRRRPDELGDEQVGRRVVELLGRAELLEHALAQDRDAVAHRHGLDLVVGDVERRRRVLALQRADLGAHLAAQLRVEVGQRLVHEERLRLADDRPAHGHPLALPAGERLRLAVQVLGQPQRLGGPLDPRRSISSFETPAQLSGNAMFSRTVMCG